MEKKNLKIHLALAFDENYITPFYVLLTSIFTNNQKNNLVIHTIATGVTELEKNKISDYVHENNAEINYYELDSSFKVEELDTPYLKSTGWTVAAYYRLYFPFLIDLNINQLLYLDTDTIVLGDLQEIYKTNINPFAAGATPDRAMFRNNDPRIIALGVNKEDYFNSGVLLINIRQWKEQMITEKTVDFIKENEELVKFPDQDALNHVLNNNYYKLSNRYNFTWDDIPVELPKKEILKSNITILHYTGIKPWKFLNPNRLRSFYYYYLKKSPHPDKNKYVDYQPTKSNLIKFLKIRFTEYYLDRMWLRKIWGKIHD
ncbi:glycosyltransferase family 8 protein [bacterium]|nr:MAG: glycosyltransferase family 8 protein [bacterium]